MDEICQKDQLQRKIPEVALPEGDETNRNGRYANKSEPQLYQEHNARKQHCPRCAHSVILLDGVAKQVDREPYPDTTDFTEGELYTKFWYISNKMNFENICVRVTREGDDFNFLSCCDCDFGPIGLAYPNNMYYICDKRVFYV